MVSDNKYIKSNKHAGVLKGHYQNIKIDKKHGSSKFAAYKSLHFQVCPV